MQQDLKEHYKEIEALLEEVDRLSTKMDGSSAMSAMAFRLIIRANNKFNDISNLGELKLNSETTVNVYAINVTADNIVMKIHTPYFNADVNLSTLTDKLLLELVHLIADKCKQMAFGPTITTTIVDGKNVPIRFVNVNNLVNCKVCTDKTVPYMDFYIPEDIFYNLNDEQLQNYCEEMKRNAQDI